MNRNVLIVNFNTQNLTDACIRSINKCTPGCSIYVFDNSDIAPFSNTFENVTVIDNTNGQIADFNAFLDKHNDELNRGGKDNNYGSFKHCLSIDAAMDIIQDGFVLMDSDILVKKDFTPLFDESKIYVGGIERMPHFKPRVAPFLCYINVKMCKEKGIRYFDEDHMFGFYDAKGGENYDTGCWFYEACKDLPKKEININSYMIHFRAASWYKDAVEKQHYKKITPEKWLEKNRKYWCSQETKQNEDKSQDEQKQEEKRVTVPSIPSSKVSRVVSFKKQPIVLHRRILTRSKE